MNVGENELVMKFYGLKLLDNKKEVKWIQEEKKILKVKRKKKVEKVVVSKIEEVESLIDEMGGVKEKMVKNKKRGRVKTNKDKVDRADYLVVFEKGKVKKKK
jgi:transcriptional regulator of NAD metabolism